MSHFKEEARKEMIKDSDYEDEEKEKPKHLFKCFNEEIENKLTFEDMVLKSVKLDKLEFDTLALERIIFAKGTLEDVWARDAERAFNSAKLRTERAITGSGATRQVPMYAYLLPGAHLVNYLYKLFETKRIDTIRMKVAKQT